MLTTTVFQFRDGTLESYVVKDFVEKMLLATPMWVAGVSIGNMCLFVTKSKKKAFITFFVIVLVIPRLIMYFAAEPFEWIIFKDIRYCLITQNFSILPYSADPNRSVPMIIAIGCLYTVISNVVGIIAFNKKKF